MATQLADFSTLAQAVWVEPTLAGKQAAMIVMIDLCKSNAEKKATFRREVNAMTNGKRVDRFAADMMLRDTDKRIK